MFAHSAWLGNLAMELTRETLKASVVEERGIAELVPPLLQLPPGWLDASLSLAVAMLALPCDAAIMEGQASARVAAPPCHDPIGARCAAPDATPRDLTAETTLAIAEPARAAHSLAWRSIT